LIPSEAGNAWGWQDFSHEAGRAQRTVTAVVLGDGEGMNLFTLNGKILHSVILGPRNKPFYGQVIKDSSSYTPSFQLFIQCR